VSLFKRIGNLFRGFFSLFVSNAERANPRALIEVEKENLRKQIAIFNDNLATHAGFVERLMRQIKDLETKERELTAKITAYIKVGNRSFAGQMALELQTVRGQLEENRQQVETAEQTYKNMVRSRDISVQEAKTKIEKLKRMISEAEMLEAQAELQEMATGMISQIGGSGDTLNRVEEYIQERRDKAKGRARVASGSPKTGSGTEFHQKIRIRISKKGDTIMPVLMIFISSDFPGLLLLLYLNPGTGHTRIH